MGIVKCTIGERIDDLLKKNNITSKELSKRVTAAGVKLSEATLSDIINDVDKGYSYKIFVEISRQLNVSTDYLFGLTDATTALKNAENEAVRICCDYTGLDENAVNILFSFRQNSYIDVLEFVNNLITYSNDNKQDISQFVFSKKPLYLTRPPKVRLKN